MKKLIELKEYNGIQLKHVWYRENGEVLTYTQAVCERCVRKPAKTVLRENTEGNYTVRSKGNALVELPSSYIAQLLSGNTVAVQQDTSDNEEVKETRASRRARRRQRKQQSVNEL